MSQTELAIKAKVSQSTVSRALNHDSSRHSGAKARLFRYADIDNYLAPGTRGKTRVVKAFDETWDGTAAHAEVIARIIEALKGFDVTEPEAEKDQ